MGALHCSSIEHTAWRCRLQLCVRVAIGAVYLLTCGSAQDALSEVAELSARIARCAQHAIVKQVRQRGGVQTTAVQRGLLAWMPLGGRLTVSSAKQYRHHK